MKKTFQKFCGLLGYKIIKIRNDLNSTNYEIIYKKLINNNPIIFDVGGNKGQMIRNFKIIFPKSMIHVFEPIREETEKLKEIYKNDHSIKINCTAVGDKNETKKFYKTYNTGTSSFLRIKPNTYWINRKANKHKMRIKDYSFDPVDTQIITLDDYAKINNIDNIDILKIDTQGYEDKVLNGSLQLIKNKKIKIIQLELMLSDIYEKTLSFHEIEKYLIQGDYKLFLISNGGNHLLDFNWQVELIYVSKKVYDEFAKVSKYFDLK